jgi:hypothetical protein
MQNLAGCSALCEVTSELPTCHLDSLDWNCTDSKRGCCLRMGLLALKVVQPATYCCISPSMASTATYFGRPSALLEQSPLSELQWNDVKQMEAFQTYMYPHSTYFTRANPILAHQILLEWLH